MHNTKFIDKDKAVGEGYLADWYIHSVAEYADENLNKPRWTEEHIEELARDFIVIPKDTPAADVAPVVHSKWEICCDGYYPYCKNCRNEPPGREMTAYCPNCGARMDGNGRR